MTRAPALRPALSLAPLLAALAGPAWAQEPGSPHPQQEGGPGRGAAAPTGDPQALSVGVPVRIQDALVTPYGEAIFQTVSTNTFVGRRDQGLTSPLQETLKVGVAPGLGLNLAVGKNLGNIGDGGTTVTPSFQYVFNPPSGWVPGVSVEGTYTPRPGTGLSGGTWGFSGQTTSNLGPTRQSPRLHLNVEWNKINDQTGRARPDTLGYGVGASMLLAERTALVTDVFYSQTNARRRSQTFLDLGVTHLLQGRLVLSAGAGAGMDRSSAAYRVFLSLSTSFSWLNLFSHGS